MGLVFLCLFVYLSPIFSLFVCASAVYGITQNLSVYFDKNLLCDSMRDMELPINC